MSPPRLSLDLSVPSTRANSLITDICQWCVRSDGGWLPSAGWVSALGSLDVPAATARTALHRMTKGGYLERAERDGRPGYAMSPSWVAYQELAIEQLAHPRSDPPGRWALLAASVPESRRPDRATLRSLLERHGFATLGNGLWIAAGHQLERALVLLETAGLDGYVDVFHADEVPGIRGSLAARCWDLARVAEAYETLAAEVRDRPSTMDPESAFADVISVANLMRRTIDRDPGLPPDSLPARWPAADAITAAEALIDERLPLAQEHTRTLH